MKIVGIDPGPEKSALVQWENGKVTSAQIMDNEEVKFFLYWLPAVDEIGIEMIASYGMPVGKEVFDTCVWIGRFLEACFTPGHNKPVLVYRRDVKLHFCHDSRAKDSNIRQAILDKFGGRAQAIGKKKTPGPLYGIKGDMWSALAIALYIEAQVPAFSSCARA